MPSGFNLSQFGNVAAATGIQLAGSIAQGAVQSRFDNMSYNRNLNYYNMQRQDSLDDWNRQNAYNDPAEQIKRLKNAGISPYQMNGQGIVSQSNNTPIKGASMQTPSAYQVNSATNQMQILNMLEQAKLTRAQVEKTQAETGSIKQQSDVYGETGRSIALGQIWTAQAQENYIKASTEEKMETIKSIKQQLLSSIEDTQLKKTQNIYQSQILKGQKTLQDKQILVQGETAQKLAQEVKQMKLMSADQVSELVQRVRQLRLSNEQQEKYAPTDELQRWSQIVGQMVGMFRR